MEAFCEKYRQRLSGKDLKCPHPSEYCKFRTSCIVHFLGQEKTEQKDEKLSSAEASKGQAARAELKKEN